MRPTRFPSLWWAQGSILLRQGLWKALPVPAATSLALQAFTSELSGKRLELLKEAVPKLPALRFYMSQAPVANAEVKDVQSAARELRLNIQTWEVRDADEFEKSICCNR